VVGAYPEVATLEASVRFANDVDSGFYDYSDMMFVAWQDDWEEDGISHNAFDRLGLAWNVERISIDGSNGREADSSLLQIQWQNGASIAPIRFDLKMDAMHSSLAHWRVYRPYTARYVLDTAKLTQVKIEWVPIGNSVCMSDTVFDGCRMVPYVCTSGQLVCPAATDENCTGCRDRDGDGYLEYDPVFCPEGDDCDDVRDDINPNEPERCDGMDSNCDGFIDAIGPNSIGESCPDGVELCGPSACNYRLVCACTDGDCYCRGGLDDDEPGVEYTSGIPATWMDGRP
jgi:hypothetical protein